MKWAMSKPGFTIVELLVVVVVIAILAVLVIVGYNGISSRATDAGLQTELSTAAKKLGVYQVDNGSYPATVTTAGITPPSGVGYKYTGSGNVFCLIYTKDQKSFYISQDGYISTGICQAGVTTTIAGSGVAGGADGNGATATFNSPAGIVADSSGVLYVGDSGTHTIRKILSNNDVVTIAGSAGVQGSNDGTGTAAQFVDPWGLAIDAAGNLYATDRYTVRKITPGGVVSTLAGSTYGYTDATGASARFGFLYGIAAESTGGAVYIADYNNNRIRKVTSGGVVTTFAGSGTAGFADGTAATARFNQLQGIAIDSSGILYVADRGNNRIRKVATNGDVTTLAGSGTAGSVDGTGTAAQFNGPWSIAVDSFGTVYVVESGTSKVRKITPSGVVTTLAGSGSGYVDATGTAARFSFPYGVTINSSGSVYVADKNNNRIRKVE